MTNKEKNGEGFSSVDLVGQCLIDEDKFNAFEAVLKKHIKSSSKVLDVGTGSGILAMTAARLGAKDVTALEFDPFVAEVAENNIKHNSLDNVIRVINDDARIVKFNLDNKFDVIVMELLATGLIDEMQVLAINNLYNQGLIQDSTTVVPYAQENYISLVKSDYSLYGFDMKMIRHLWSHDKNSDLYKNVSDNVLMNKIIFNTQNPEIFETEIKFKINENSEINGVCLTSKILVDKTEDIILESTHSLNPIVIVPLPEKIVSVGDEVNIKIKYSFGGGFKNFSISYID